LLQILIDNDIIEVFTFPHVFVLHVKSLMLNRIKLFLNDLDYRIAIKFLIESSGLTNETLKKASYDPV